MIRRLSTTEFINTLWEYYSEYGRQDMAWRLDTRPYYVVVSEIMLQQTQVERVKVKFADFIAVFPDWYALSQASQTEVISQWQGLGYNRRALFLHNTAQKVVAEYKAQLPNTIHKLEELPGIGSATAGAISAFAFNLPVVFIETNIRRVFIHNFFTEREHVTDKEILARITTCVARLQDSSFEPRTFYWALMDYGTHLKNTLPNPNKRSAHYSVQSKFEGSIRQLRGKVLRILLNSPHNMANLQHICEEGDDKKFINVIRRLEDEGFIVVVNQRVSLK